MTRVFEQRRVWRMDPESFHAGVELLASAIAAQRAPHLIVGVGRGGVPLASALAAHLAAPMSTVTARHNLTDARSTPASGHVEVDRGDIAGVPLVPGAQVLVTDDICGSGATLAAVTRALAGRVHPVVFTTATLCCNEGSTRRPDLWLWDVADWVVFPWEASHGADTEPLPAPTSVRRSPR